MNLHTQISTRRKELKLTQLQLAELCGMPQSMISSIESGKVNMNIDTAERIAKALKCSLDITLTPHEIAVKSHKSKISAKK